MKSAQFVSLCLVLAGCAQPSENSTPRAKPVMENREATPQEASADAPQPSMTMSGVDLYMHDYEPTEGELRDPTFWIHARTGQLGAGEKIWSLQDARAVIHTSARDDLIIEADEGRVDQREKTALLKGDVRLTTGTLLVELSELLWSNPEGVAKSDKTISLTEGDTRLTAAKLTIYPDDDLLILQEGSGYLSLSERTPR